MATQFKNRKGVQTIHLFNEVWRIGRLTYMKGTKQPHCVIYSPQDKEHHVYDNEALALRTIGSYKNGGMIHLTNRANLAKVKIYIQTTILGERDDWTFDLTSLPKTGDCIKVIYDNGTIKNITFNGHWDPISIERSVFAPTGEKLEFDEQQYKIVTPICWKIK